jgi:arylsulfatase A-like enzyme
LSIPIRSHSDAIGAHASLARPALLVFAALAAPISLRAILLVEHAMAPGAGDLRGLLSDVSVALGVAAAVGLLARLSRWAGTGVLLLWVLLCYGNYEHVSANGANMALRDAGYLADETFLLGSALAVTRPWLLVGALAAALGFGWAALRPGARVRLRTLAIGCVVAAVAFAFWSTSSEMLGWRQTSFVAQNASWLVKAIAVRDSIAPSAPSTPSAPELVAPDFDGEPLVAFGDSKTNVLLVFLEGVSGAYIEPIAAANARKPIGASMPRLSGIARDHVIFTSFIAQQRQTNRGEYAVLCGDLPRLFFAEAKMSELATNTDTRWRKRCLPAALAEAGYATVYLQAAPTSFMLKDQFMPRIGFERSLGEEYFENAYSRNQWGVDDRSFLQQSLQMIDELRDGERPWFLTLLTVGTHHPINVPADFTRAADSDDKWRAFDYLDVAVSEFVSALESRGVLDDTLVLLLSDESQGLRKGLSELEIRLSQSWGFLVAMLPGGEKLRVDVPYAQFDIAGSILDWLGLADYARGFSGRSVFRRYATPRPLVFGNVYVNWAGGVSADGQLVLCLENFQMCRRAATKDQRLFRSGLQPLPEASPDEIAFLRERAAESVRISEFPPENGDGFASGAARDFRLREEPVFSINDDVEDKQWVFGGQSLSVPANSRIDVDLEVEVIGEAGHLDLQHALKSGKRLYFGQAISDIQPGGRFHFRYSYSNAAPIINLGNYLVVTRRAGSGLSLNLLRARMRILPESGAAGRPLVVHQLDVELSADPAAEGGAVRP